MQENLVTILSNFVTDDKLSGSGSKDIMSSIIQQIILTYLRDEFWYLPTCNIIDADSSQRQLLSDHLELVKLEAEPNSTYWEKGLSFEQLNSNIQLTCLLIEAMALCSSVLKDEFGVFLIRVLYPLLEKHGNENAEIARAAHDALVCVSRNCGESSVAELISHNADYLTNAISMSFRHLTLFSSAPCVLSVMLTYCDAGVLPMVTDVIQDVFYRLDMYQNEIVFSLMRVLRSFVSAVNEWFAEKGTVADTAKTNYDKKVLYLF